MMEIQKQIETLQKMQINLYGLLETATRANPNNIDLEGLNNLFTAVEHCDSLLELKTQELQIATEKIEGL